jgi:FkbM family methyltransferase
MWRGTRKDQTLSALRRTVKKIAGVLTGCEIEHLGGRSVAFIDKRRRSDGWFSHRMQLRSVIERCRIDLVLDVGANVGQFAQGIRSYYPGEIHSFEPVSSAYERLAATAGQDPAWKVHRLALGNTDSTRTIHVARHTVFSSLLHTNAFGARRFGEEALAIQDEVVMVRRLEGLLEEIIPDFSGRRVFMKLDTQGSDLDVFQGLQGKQRSVLALQSEVSLVSIYDGMSHWTECVRSYEDAGFRVAGMFPVIADDLQVLEYDCLLVRADGPVR